jgi:transcriptional regulator with XRE-family HTH domain
MSDSILDVNATIGYGDDMAKRFSDQIRQAVDASGMTRYAICKALGIDQATMSRFMAGSGMELSNLDRLADLLGLTVKRPAKRRAGKAR